MPQQKFKLGLHLPTDPRWVNLAAMSLEDILTDHAYCEQKAALSCISLIAHYPEMDLIIDKVSPLVTEEWGHFRLVVKEIRNRGLKLGKQRKDLYVNAIFGFQKKHCSHFEKLLDKLIICALIEARSCERFRLLSIELTSKELQEFYYQFMVSEAGHYRLFLDLAIHYFGEDIAYKRWDEYLAFEKTVLQTFEPRGDRIH